MNSILILLSFFQDFSYIVGGTIASILALVSALLGLGWGVRHVMQYITGSTSWGDVDIGIARTRKALDMQRQNH